VLFFFLMVLQYRREFWINELRQMRFPKIYCGGFKCFVSIRCVRKQQSDYSSIRSLKKLVFFEFTRSQLLGLFLIF